MTSTRDPVRAPLACAALLLALGACTDSPMQSGPGEGPPTKPMLPVGVVEVTITGIGGPQMSISAGGPSLVLTRPGNTGGTGNGSIQLEGVGSGSFTEGSRTGGGQRYVWATFRVRNAQSNGVAYDTPRQNLTFLAATTAGTIGGSPFNALRRFDNTNADPAIAPLIVPTGAVMLDDSLRMRSQFADVLQVFTEAEAGAVALPAGVTGLFPYGFVVRNPETPNSRTLPASPGPNQWDGLVTFAFRLPLQATPSADPYSVSAVFLVVDDSETKVTESIEEQGAADRARVAARATALGATTVTVLAGSPSMGAYTGERRICSVRTAGAAATPTTYITRPGAYTRLALYRQGERVDACAEGFRTGTPTPLGVGVVQNVTARAMDRYGNVLPATLDSITLTADVPGLSAPGTTALSSGEALLPISFDDYGTPTLLATGRRQKGRIAIPVVGITRTWTGAVSTDWSVGGNWDVGAPPMWQDTASIPAGTPNQPALTIQSAVGGVSVADGAVLSLGGFSLEAFRDVHTGALSGGITSTTGRLILSGSGGTLRGRLPEVLVRGTYTLSGDVLLKTPALVDLGGGLESVGWGTEIRHY